MHDRVKLQAVLAKLTTQPIEGVVWRQLELVLTSIKISS